MPESRVYFNIDTQEIVVSESKPKPAKLWRVIPKLVGIIWSDDQSNNQITFYWGKSQQPDYIFDPRDDLKLLLEYTDQLSDMF